MKVSKMLCGGVALLVAGAAWTESFQEVYKKGMEEYNAKKYADAAETLAKAAKLAQKPAEKYGAMFHRGHSLELLKNHEQAAAAFSELLAVDGLSEGQKDEAAKRYVHNLYHHRQYQKVIDFVSQALADEHSSNSLKTYCAYAGYLSHMGLKQYPEAEKMGVKLTELNQNGGIWHDRGLVYQAAALRMQQKYDEVATTLSDAVIAKMSPVIQGEARIELINTLRLLKKYPEMATEAGKIYDLDQAGAYQKESAICFAIEALNAAGNTEDAITWMERVDGITNQYLKTLGLLRVAQLLEKQEKLTEAKAKYQACADNGPWWKQHCETKINAIDKKLAQ